jgi:hypothetical protein
MLQAMTTKTLIKKSNESLLQRDLNILDQIDIMKPKKVHR